MTLAVQRFLAKGAPDAAAVDAFLEEHDFPLAEGRQVTFAFRGEADAVRLQHFIYGLETSQDFTRVPGTDLWTLSMEIPPASRVEYKLLVEAAGRRELIQDPLSPDRACGAWTKRSPPSFMYSRRKPRSLATHRSG